MKPKERKTISDLNKCDFWDFYDFYEEQAAKRRRLSPKEKQVLSFTVFI